MNCINLHHALFFLQENVWSYVIKTGPARTFSYIIGVYLVGNINGKKKKKKGEAAMLKMFYNYNGWNMAFWHGWNF